MANGFKDDIELLAMLLIAPFQVRDFPGKLIDGKCHLPQADKSPHDGDVYLNGARAA